MNKDDVACGIWFDAWGRLEIQVSFEDLAGETTEVDYSLSKLIDEQVESQMVRGDPKTGRGPASVMVSALRAEIIRLIGLYDDP